MTTYGVLIFDGAEELDFVGPWEVFAGLFSANDGGRVHLIPIERRDAPLRRHRAR